jgi:hypothetical protein
MSRTQYELDEDFVGAFIGADDNIYTANGVWLVGGVGTPTASIINDVASAPGLVRLSTSATLDDTVLIRMPAAFLGSEVLEVGIRFRVPTLTTVQLALGLSEDFTYPGSGDARYILLDTGTDNNLRSVTQNTGTTITATAIAVAANTFKTVRMRKSGAGVLAQTIIEDAAGAVQGVFNHTVSANLYGATQASLALQIKTGTAGVRTLDIDRVFLRSERLAR